jgi:hypothetical protein
MRTLSHPIQGSRIQLWLAIVGVSCLLLQSASAAVLFSEAFDYTAGTGLSGKINPGNSTAWSTAGATLSITNANLTYPGLADLGGNALSITNGSATSSINTFANQTSGQIYYSFLLDVIAADSGNQYFTAMNPGTTAPGGSADAIDCYLYSNGNIGLRTAGKSTVTSGPLSLSTTYFVVEEYDFSASTAYLYLNPTPGGAMPGATLSLSGSTATAIDNVGFKAQASGTTGSYLVDNLRIGTTWADVTPAVPEPSTWMLVVSGFALMIGFVRHRR